MTTDDRLDRIERLIENLARSMQDFRTETQNLTGYVQELRTETINRLEIVDSRLTVLTATFTSLDSRMAPLTKAILDFGGIASRLQVEQSRIAKLVEPAA